MSTPAATPFPRAPWSLRGSAMISVWRVPLDALPVAAANGARLVSLGRQALCATVWARYEPGGTLAYNELLFAVAVQSSGIVAPACTVGPIWVDDEAAAAGGRTLWGIPKRMGVFQAGSSDGPSPGFADGAMASITVDGRRVATLQYEPPSRLQVPVRLPIWTVQDGDSGPIRTRCMLRGRMSRGAGRWFFEPDGPLSFLAGREPLASARLESLSARFGV